MFAWIQRDRAVKQAKIAFSRQLSAQAFSHLDNQLDLAILLSVEANQVEKTLEASKVLSTSLNHQPSLVAFLHGHTSSINSLAFSQDGNMLASADSHGIIKLWSLKDFEPVGQPLKSDSYYVSSLEFGQDGKTVIAVTGKGDITWDLATLRPIQPPLNDDLEGVTIMAISPDGKTLACNGGNNVIVLLDRATHKRIGVPIQPHTGGVSAAAFSPDGRTLATIGFNNQIQLWNVATQQPVGALFTGEKLSWYEGLPSEYHLVFSQDGKTLASHTGGSTITLWDVATHEQRPIRVKQSSEVTSVAFSLPFGNWGNEILASGSDEGAVSLWNTHTQEQLSSPLKAPRQPVTSLAFGWQGKLASGSENGTIILWEVPGIAQPPADYLDEINESTSLDVLQNKACRIANRNLTPNEWKEYLRDKPYHKTCPNLP
jgi:WD40 repeat protein